MKWTKLLSIALFAGLLGTNCQQEEVLPADQEINVRSEVKMVPLKGHFVTTEDSEAPPIPCYFGDVFFGPSPSAFFYDGNITHLGELDFDESRSTITYCDVIDPVNLVGEFGMEIVWKNYDGDGLTFEGVAILTAPDWGGTANWTITGGFGKFENASGWGMVTITTQAGVKKIDGMVTQPNH